MKSIKLDIENYEGYKLSAELDLPVDQKPHNYVLFSHCFTCNKNLLAVKYISQGLTEQGFGVLKFDFTGLGHSEGEFGETNFSTNVQDLKAAVEYLDENFEAPTILVGHSLGGAAALKAGFELDQVKAIATIGAPYDPSHVTHLFEPYMDQILKEGQAKVILEGRPFIIKKSFIEDIEAHKVVERLRQMRKSILIMHSPQDNTVGIENARKIYENAIHPKSFISLDGANHLLSKRADAMYAGTLIGQWASRYVDIPEDSKTLKTDHEVVVDLNTDDKFTTQIQAGNHHFKADEPKEVGGENFGPSPYDLVSSGLGACTAMTLYMYARRKKWPLSNVRVHLSHEKKHLDSIENESKIDFFEREIELTGMLSKEQRARLLEIAERCPVHKTISKGSEIKTSLKS